MTTTEEIKGEVSSFYRNLIGTVASNLDGIDVNIVRKGKQLAPDAAESLVKHVLDAKTDNALKGIDINKAPGLDGFNSLFFIKAWAIVKADIYEAVKDFFRPGVMLRQCLQTVSYSILIDGLPTTLIAAKKGLRQGDPMSPYLFALGMEYLSRCLATLAQNPEFLIILDAKELI
ncbi:uncharacterized protein [Spinacia oleracea]|uniref:Reverse transcriptase domain-containing protein n=1 Tax=Spinacia oleracea TaxID=3562 RepID=A0ABM3R989_SPIOL|nr:uncharacterized protein LOC130467634 [Spinacia oleracea]